MKIWLISVVSVLIAISLLSVLIPKGKLTPLINSVLSVIFLLTVFSPFFSGKVTLENVFVYTEDDCDKDFLQENYLYYTAEKETESKKTKCLKKLKENGINDVYFEIEYSKSEHGKYEIKKVKVFYDGTVIKEKDEHIDIIRKINSAVNECFGKKDLAVEVYER